MCQFLLSPGKLDLFFLIYKEHFFNNKKTLEILITHTILLINIFDKIPYIKFEKNLIYIGKIE